MVKFTKRSREGSNGGPGPPKLFSINYLILYDKGFNLMASKSWLAKLQCNLQLQNDKG